MILKRPSGKLRVQPIASRISCSSAVRSGTTTALTSGKINVLDGARGRTRTDTLLKAVDFHLTSAFAALSDITQVRGLEHAFTLAARL